MSTSPSLFATLVDAKLTIIFSAVLIFSECDFLAV